MRQHILAALFIILASFILVNAAPAAAATVASPQTYNFDGQLTDTTNTPVAQPNINVLVDIFDVSGTCLLYEETDTIDTSLTNGYFAIAIGSAVGSVKRTGSDPHQAMSAIFSNSATITGQSCAYTPNIGDGRQLKATIISVNGGAAVNDQLTALTIAAVPYATVADSVQGLGPTNLIQVDSNVTQTALDNLLTNTNLQNVISGKLPSATGGGSDLPTFAGTPASPVAGAVWFNSTLGQLQYFNGSVQTLGAGGGGVTSLAAGSGISLSGSTGAVTVSVGTLSTPGQVSGAAITSGAIGGSTSFSSTGAISTTANISGAGVTASTGVSTPDLQLYNPGSNTIQVKAPSTAFGNYSLVLPINTGTPNQYLVGDGAGNLSWGSIDIANLFSDTGLAPAFPAANCAAGQVIQWSSVSGNYTCQTIASAFGTQPANSVYAAPVGTANNPSFRALDPTDVNSFAFVNGGNAFGVQATLGTNDVQNLVLQTNGAPRVTLGSAGGVGIGVTASPSAALALQPGTTTTAPLLFNSGALLSTPSPGALEYDGINLFFTNSTATRMTLANTTASQTFSGTNTFSSSASFTGTGTGLSVSNNATVGGTLGVTGSLTAGSLVGPNTGTFTITAGAGNLGLTLAATGSGAVQVGSGANSINIGNLGSSGSVTIGNTIGGTKILNNIGIGAAPVAGTALNIASVNEPGASSYGLFVTAPTGATNNYAASFMGGSAGIVGIGTTTPTAPLHVVGTNGFPQVSIQGNQSAGSKFGSFLDLDGAAYDGGTLWRFEAAGTNAAEGAGNFLITNRGGLGTAGNPFTIMPSGNVGINTISPSTNLEVNGNAVVDNTLTATTYLGTGGNVQVTATGTSGAVMIASGNNGPGPGSSGGVGILGSFIQGAWQAAGSGMQTGTTITSASAIFTQAMLGSNIIWANGTYGGAISVVNSPTSVTVQNTGTVSTITGFNVYYGTLSTDSSGSLYTYGTNIDLGGANTGTVYVGGSAVVMVPQNIQIGPTTSGPMPTPSGSPSPSPAGNISMYAQSSTNSAGGSINIAAGSSVASQPAGNVSINAGGSGIATTPPFINIGTNPSGTVPVNITVGEGEIMGSGTGGTTTLAGQSVSVMGNGGNVYIAGGNGGVSGTGGAGGNIAIIAGNPGGANQNGGSVQISSSPATGTGTNGAINFQSNVVNFASTTNPSVAAGNLAGGQRRLFIDEDFLSLNNPASTSLGLIGRALVTSTSSVTFAYANAAGHPGLIIPSFPGSNAFMGFCQSATAGALSFTDTYATGDTLIFEFIFEVPTFPFNTNYIGFFNAMGTPTYGVGIGLSAAATPLYANGSTLTTAGAATTPLNAAAYNSVRIVLDENGLATFYFNGLQVGSASTSGSFNGKTFCPGIFHSASASSMTIDYMSYTHILPSR